MAEFPVNIKLKAIDGVSKILKSVNGNFDQLSKKVGKATKNIGKKLSIGITAPVAAAATGSVAAFAQFDNGFRGVETLLDDASFGAKGLTQGVEEMRKGILNVAKTSPSSLEQLNKSLFDTVSAGVSAGKAVEVVNTASKLAVAGLTDAATATNGMTSALNGFKISADDADKVAAKFFTAQKFGKTTIAELSKDLGKVAPLASSMGVSFDEVLASVSAATTAGIKTNEAFTALKATMANIIDIKGDAKIAAEALGKAYGITFDAKHLKTKGLKVFIDDVVRSANKIGVEPQKALQKLFGSIEALNFVTSIAGDQNKVFKNILSELNDETKLRTTFNNAFEKQAGSLSNRLAVLKNRVLVLAVSIGEKLEPFVTMVADAFGRFIDFLQANPKIAQLAGIFALVAAAIGPVLIAVGTLITLLPGLIAGWGLLTAASLPLLLTIGAIPLAIAGLVAAGYFLIKNWETVGDFFKDLWGFIKQSFYDGVDELLKLTNFLPDFVKDKLGISANVNVGGSAEGRRLERTVPQFGQELQPPSSGGRGANESKVIVDFKNMPQGTKVKTESTNNDTMFGINTGLQGAAL